MKSIWTDPLKMEQKVREIVTDSSHKGWTVDVDLVDRLISQLEHEIDTINNKVTPLIPLTPKPVPNTVTKIRVANGGYTSQVKKWYVDDLLSVTLFDIVEGAFTRVDWVQINLGSDKQIKEYLLSQGWVPTTWNYKKDKDKKYIRDAHGQRVKSSPKLTEDSFESVEGEVPALIALGLKYRNRLSTLKGWKDQITEEGKIHGDAFTCGAATARMRHNVIVNVPGVESTFGAELRSIFTVPNGYKIVGCDASGCQLRMLASALNVENDFTNAILYGTKEDRNDAHCIAADMAGGLSRQQGKTLNYSILFGQSDAALARALGVTLARAVSIKSNFFKQVPELPALLDSLHSEWRRSARSTRNRYIIGLDGRKIYVDSQHKLLNYKLQSDEAIAMKMALCFLHKWIEDRELESRLLIFMHDEFQLQVPLHEVDVMCELSPKSIVKSGQYLGLNVPLAAEVGVGMSWKETH